MQTHRGQRLCRHLFVQRVAVGMQEANSHGSDPLIDEAGPEGRDLCRVDRGFDSAVGQRALRHLQPPVAGDQQGARLGPQGVDVAAHVPSDLQDIAKTAGCQQSAGGQLALQHRVGGDG